MITSRRLSAFGQLKLASENNPPLKNGAKGEGVAAIQDLLADLGGRLKKSFSKGKPDGIYGSETHDAVLGFQTRARLKGDGIAGKLTIHELDRIVRATPAIELPDAAACAHQEILNRSLPLPQRTRAAW